MNARAEQHLVEQKIELIPVAAIAPSETHIQALRRKRYDLEGLANLAASIMKLGVQQPGVVRKLPALRGLAAYELVCGERRWRATRQAGLNHFPAIVRELDDGQVLEVQLVENLQRETLHPLEEAVGYDELIKVAKLTADQVGDRVGLSRSWVYSRLNLLKLEGPARQALESGAIDVSRALVVASIAQPNQRAEALRLAGERNHDGKFIYSVRELRHKIGKDQLTKPLTGAPFPLVDITLLPEMGACGPCRYRTGNCDPEALDPDVCTNLSCFHLKVKAQADRVRKSAAAAGREILRGEAARQVSPSPLTVYGHVDLDNICDHDYFPEKEPKQPQGVDHEAWERHPLYLSWDEREKLWQPRTYRALLEGAKYSSVLIECPKNKGLLRELVPFKEAQPLLKKRGIDLPSYANRKRQSHQAHRSEATPKAETPQAKAKREADQQKAVVEEAIQKRVTLALLEEVKKKQDGALGLAELAYLGAGPLQDDIDEETSAAIWKMFGVKDPGYRCEAALAKLSSKDLPKAIAVGLVAQGLGEHHFRGQDKLAAEILKRLKIDRKKVDADVRAAAKKEAERKK